MYSNCPEHIWIMSLHPSVMWCWTATLYFAFLLWWRYFMTVFESQKNIYVIPESKAFLDHLHRRKMAQINSFLGNLGWGKCGLRSSRKSSANLEVSDHYVWNLKCPHLASCPLNCIREIFFLHYQFSLSYSSWICLSICIRQVLVNTDIFARRNSYKILEKLKIQRGAIR